MARLPFKSLETLEALVRLGSATGAARELGLSQSAVSNSLRRFEQDLGRKLFYRKGTRLVPTTDAEQMAAAVSRAISEIQASMPKQHPTTEPNVVRLCVSPTFAASWLAPKLDALRKRMQPVAIQVSSRVDLEDQADLWIRHAKRGQWEGLLTTPLLKETKAPVAAPRFISRAIVRDEDVAAYPLIGVDARPNEWKEWARKAGLSDTMNVETTFDVTSNAWEAARTGSGVALGDLDFLKHSITSGALMVLGQTTLSSYRYFLCRRSGDNRRSVRMVWDWLCSQ